MDFWKSKVFWKVSLLPWIVLCDWFWSSPTNLHRQCNDFHPKILINLFRISFYKLLKIISMMNFGMLKKVWLFFFIFLIHSNAHSQICDHKKKFNQTWKKKNKVFTFFGFLRKTKLFRKCCDFPWNNFGLDISVCIVNVMFSIKKYLSNFFRISFD